MNKALIGSRYAATASRPVERLYQPAQQPYIAAVREKLLAGTYRLQPTSCPCGAEAGEFVIAEIERYGLPLVSVVCDACGTVRFNPYLDDASLQEFYTHYYQQMYGRSTDVDLYFARQRSYGKRILAGLRSTLPPGGLIAEIGCGAGGALAVFHQQGFAVAGCDYSSALIVAGRERGVPGLVVGNLAELAQNLDGARANLILLHHVFEHVDDPVALLRGCRSLLAPDGRVVIAVPDIGHTEWSRHAAGDLLEFLHIAHKYNFSMPGLVAIAAQAGFDARAVAFEQNLATPWSVAPELWVSFHLRVADQATAAERKRLGRGATAIAYFRRTERLYSLGLCPGQLVNALRGVIPQRVLRRSGARTNGAVSDDP